MADDDLAARVAKLEAELAETKKALDAVKPKEPDRPRLNMPPVDWTASMRMPPDAAKKMALNVKAGKQTADEVRSSWARNSMFNERGGFGPGPGGNWESPSRARIENSADAKELLVQVMHRNLTEVGSVDELLDDRGKTHGLFGDNARISQAMKSAWRNEKGYERLNVEQREALDYIAGKISRILSGEANHVDAGLMWRAMPSWL